MFSRPLLLTLKMPPRQILNRANTQRMMFINMFARSSTLNSLQVLLKSLSALLVSESQGTKLRRFTLASFRKTQKSQDQPPQDNGRHAQLQHQVRSQLSIS